MLDFDYHLFVLSLCNNVGKVALSSAKQYMDRYEVDFPNEQAYVQLISQLKSENGRIKSITRADIQKALDLSDKILDRSEAAGIHLIQKQNAYYPPQLRKIPDSPEFLYARGNLDALLGNHMAIVGSRSPSEFGLKVGERLIGKYLLQAYDYTIVSGLAKGCDAMAHRMALSYGTPTVAVLPTDLLNVYPSEHAPLAQKIAREGGCLLSEYPLGTVPQKQYFKERDRIQAGMSNGVIVIETELQSGTMHTAQYAQEFAKPRACIFAHDHPNYLTKGYQLLPTFQGNKFLVEDKHWFPLRNAEDIQKFHQQVDRSSHQQRI
ncbi:DNA-processing protein DprA [Persicobacter diffluens]|uniref:Smf/DprA SLOG domain-containing protein n=1 Tax=Persicobacter diffluens TaxID=981 RepID=A0AAN4W4F9_9BACT|nr:hypothetical protein PEDI_44270 [Persicobacter diffluens]